MIEVVQATIIKLFVAITIIIAGSPMTDTAVYQAKTWDTVEACEAFVKSDEGQASLNNVKAYLTLTYGDENPQLVPECKADTE